MDKNVTDDHPYCEIFKRNTLKVFYSCMSNMKKPKVIHNRKIKTRRTMKGECVTAKSKKVNGSFQIENVVFKATVTTNNLTKFYDGSTGLSFKNCNTKHRYSF